MIDKKYLGLINKDLDNIISEREKKALQKFLGENPDARNYYDNIKKTEELLDSIHEREPSAELEYKILNSIDYNRYASKSKRMHLFDIILSALKAKWAFSFSFGIVAGIILLALILSITSRVNTSLEEDVYGTIGITSTEVSRSISAETPDYSFKIDVLKVKAKDEQNHFAFNVDLTASDDYILEMNYNAGNVLFENLSSVNSEKINFESSPGIIRIHPSKSNRFSLMLAVKNSPEEISIHLYRGNENILNRSISLM